MSTTIDERVVEMRFDNKQFESKVTDYNNNGNGYISLVGAVPTELLADISTP